MVAQRFSKWWHEANAQWDNDWSIDAYIHPETHTELIPRPFIRVGFIPLICLDRTVFGKQWQRRRRQAISMFNDDDDDDVDDDDDERH